MPNRFDLLYFSVLLLGSPLWLLKSSLRRKLFHAWRNRNGSFEPRHGNNPGVLIHAVSVGEVNAAAALIRELRNARPDLSIHLSVTTSTGLEQAQRIFAPTPKVRVIRFPNDFSGSVRRTLDALRPHAVVLMELEVWPNFVLHCTHRNIPVLIVNGRITEPSFRRYRTARMLLGGTFRRLAAVCAQDDVYAERFAQLGVDRDRIEVTGVQKFDNVQVNPAQEPDRELARDLALRPGEEPIWVCGSTGPGEETIILRHYRQLLRRFAGLRLAIIPRHPDRFEPVARLIEEHQFHVRRRSDAKFDAPPGPLQPVVLGDTMGELKRFYSLADVVFVGRSLVDLGPRQHGSDMIEPAAMAKPVIVGPFTSNFQEAVNKFLQADAMLVAEDGESLEQGVAVLLSSPDEARAMGRRASDVVRANQGTTARHVRRILEFLDSDAVSGP